MSDAPIKTILGLPVQIMDGLPADTVIIGRVAIVFQGNRPIDAVIDGVVIKFGEGHAQG